MTIATIVSILSLLDAAIFLPYIIVNAVALIRLDYCAASRIVVQIAFWLDTYIAVLTTTVIKTAIVRIFAIMERLTQLSSAARDTQVSAVSALA